MNQKYKSARSSLREISVRPDKRFGQNFITDSEVVSKIVQFAEPSGDDTIVEIGPGLGALTESLAAIRPNLTVIEIEPELAQKLKVRFPEITVLQQDVRQVEFQSLGRDLVVFGNLPYSFSTEIVFHLIESAATIKRAVIMLQREFVERMAAEPGGRDYGTLSIGVQLWCDLKLGPIISGDSFYPTTKVDSRVVELKFLKQPRFEISDLKWFRKIVKASFSNRRKKLLNSLSAAGIWSKEILTEVLQSLAIDPGRRAETLSIAEYVKLAEQLRQLQPQAVKLT